MFALALKICCVVVFAASLGADDSTKFKRIDQLISVIRNRTGAPGMAVAVIENGEVVFSRTYGLRNLADEKSAVTADTLFPIASCSETFTAYQIASLVKEGLVAYDDPVIKYIPEFQMADYDVTQKITVKDLLSMASGLPGHDSVWYHSNISRNELLERIRHLELNRGLREKYQHNSIMFTVAGMIVERVTNRSWEDDVYERIFKPLNMSRSLPSFAKFQQLPVDADLAKGYTYERNSTKVVFVPIEDVTMIGPAKGLFSNLNDLVKWVRFQMSETIPKKMHVGKPPYFKQNDSHFDTTNGWLGGIGYGYGWRILNHRRQNVVDQIGQADGYSTVISLFSGTKRGYVVLANLDTLTAITPKLPARMDDIMSNHSLLKSDEKWLSGLLGSGSCSLLLDEISPGKQVESPRKYGGFYWNAGYGYVEVSTVQSGLSLVYNNIQYLLAPQERDNFFILLPQSVANTDGGHVTEGWFDQEPYRGVFACHVIFEPNVSPIVFMKNLREAKDLKYLDLFVGVFKSSTPNTPNVKIDVDRGRHELLTFGVPSDYWYVLKPLRRDFFGLEVRLMHQMWFEFVFANETVSGLIIHQQLKILHTLSKVGSI